MALKFSLILQAIDRFTAPARKVERATKKMTRSTEELDRRLAIMARNAPKWRRVFAIRTLQLFNLTARYTARGGVRLLGKGIELAARGAARLSKKLLSLTTQTLKYGAAAAVAFAGYAVFDIFRVGSKFEQAEIKLAKITGSMASARREIMALAAMDLPVPVAELTAAYVELREAGLNPTAQQMRQIVAEAVNGERAIGDLAKALKEAKNGDFGSLEMFDIQASKKKGEVLFSYLDKEGKRVTRRAIDNAKSVEDALIGIFGARSAGALDAYAGSFEGLIARIKNQWTLFELRVANAGIYDKVKNKIAEWLDKVAEMAEDGRLEKWAKRISDWLEKAFDKAVDFIENTDWKKVGNDIERIVKLLGKVFNWLDRIITRAGGMKRAFENALPPHLLQSWRFVSKLVLGGEEGGSGKPSPPKAKPAKPSDIKANNDALFNYIRNRNRPALSRPQARRPNIPGAAATRDVKVSGRTEVEIRYSGPLSARLTRNRQAGDVPTSVTLGKTMAGAA